MSNIECLVDFHKSKQGTYIFSNVKYQPTNQSGRPWAGSGVVWPEQAKTHPIGNPQEPCVGIHEWGPYIFSHPGPFQIQLRQPTDGSAQIHPMQGPCGVPSASPMDICSIAAPPTHITHGAFSPKWSQVPQLIRLMKKIIILIIIITYKKKCPKKVNSK